MKKLLSISFFLMLINLCFSQNISGTYQTRWGDLILRQSGTSVTGNYPHKSGTIEGVIGEQVLTGKWTETEGEGRIRFVFNEDFSAFSGSWGDGNDEPTQTGWDGTKITNAIPSYAHVSGTFSTQWGDLVIRQTGNKVTGTYPNNGGVVEGFMDGKVLTGKWSEFTGSGKIRFVFSDDLSSFTGTWSEGNAEPTKTGWDGRKK